jgi:hypothetical protein
MADNLFEMRMYSKCVYAISLLFEAVSCDWTDAVLLRSVGMCGKVVLLHPDSCPRVTAVNRTRLTTKAEMRSSRQCRNSLCGCNLIRHGHFYLMHLSLTQKNWCGIFIEFFLPAWSKMVYLMNTCVNTWELNWFNPLFGIFNLIFFLKGEK